MFRSKRTRNTSTPILDHQSDHHLEADETTNLTSNGSSQQAPNNYSESQMNSGDNSSHNVDNEEHENGEGSRRNAKRMRRSIPVNANSTTNEEARDWSDDINFDEREDVRAIDSEGNVQLWSGSIQPNDVWFLENGVRFESGKLAKGDATILGDIVKLIRGKFIILDSKIYNDAMIKHVGKHRRQWKFDLKARYFNPIVQTRTEIENNNAPGIVRENWIELVDYWYSDKSKKYAEIGREARASLGHLHTNGATSFANSRYEFEIEHGREPGSFEFFDKTHKPKDGSYPNNTNTAEFINTAKSKIESTVTNSSSSMPQVEIENEIFNELMYDKDKTNQRPIGYGFGVKRNDVFGVHALLRKRGVTIDNGNNGDQNLKVEFAMYKKHTTDLPMRLTTQMTDVLGVVQSGNISNEMLDATCSALRSISAQVSEFLVFDFI